MKKIVIIEDDTDIQEVYREILSKLKYHVYPTTSGSLGFQMVKTEKPDLVILDIIIPEVQTKLNGIEVLKRIRKNPALSHIPVLIISNLSSQKDEALRSGATDYMEKINISLDDFTNKVKQLTNLKVS